MSKSDKILGAILATLVIVTTGFLFWQNFHAALAILPFPQHETPPPKITTIFLAGDIMLSRNVDAKMVAGNDFTLPFASVKNETQNADISFANLESPFNSTGAHFVEGSLTFNANPQAVAGLQTAGFDVLSTANNHTLDQGPLGLELTYNLLKQNGILPIGTTPECHKGVVVTRNKIKFGFLAYSYTALNNGQHSADPSVCDANDLAKTTADIKALKVQADIVFVSMHMGIEYTRHPTATQTAFAHNAIDAGADFVVGAHPHWIQDIENYHGKYIFYSLGNFVFDQMWSTDTREGLTVKLTYADKELSKIELNPVIIENFCCPRFANAEEATAILGKSNLTSSILLPHN